MSVLTANSRRDLEIHRYPAPIYLLVPIAALVLQALLSRYLSHFPYFDLPLVITIYFALARRSPIQGMFLGLFVGIFEDALTHHAIGINGIAKTLAGYLAASVGLRIDVENMLIRLLLNFALTLMCSGIYLAIYRGLLGLEMEWSWLNTVFQAVGNSVLALLFFPMLDRLQIRD